MTNIEKLLLQVRQVKTFLESAEAALVSSGDDSAKVGAAAVSLEAAEEAFKRLLEEVRSK